MRTFLGRFYNPLATNELLRYRYIYVSMCVLHSGWCVRGWCEWCVCVWVCGGVPKNRRLQQIVPSDSQRNQSLFSTHTSLVLKCVLIQMYLYVALLTFCILLIILSQTVKKNQQTNQNTRRDTFGENTQTIS